MFQKECQDLQTVLLGNYSRQVKHLLEDAPSVSTMVFGTKCQHVILMQDGALFHHLLKVPTH